MGDNQEVDSSNFSKAIPVGEEEEAAKKLASTIMNFTSLPAAIGCYSILDDDLRLRLRPPLTPSEKKPATGFGAHILDEEEEEEEEEDDDIPPLVDMSHFQYTTDQEPPEPYADGSPAKRHAAMSQTLIGMSSDPADYFWRNPPQHLLQRAGECVCVCVCV